MGVAETTVTPTFDVDRVRADFPILRQQVHGHPLVYLDNANTTQKPQAVIDAVSEYYLSSNANIHRATHLLSERATRAYERSRVLLQRFINAADSHEVILTRGCTDGINLVAQAWGRTFLRPGDEVLISWMEHHSNIVPWQIVCEQTGATLRAVPINERGELRMEEFDRLLTDRTRLVAMIHVSNALGTIAPIAEIVRKAHAAGALALIDGAQAAAHVPVDVQAIDADFYAFSGHKMFGPTGTGVLYGKAALLDSMPPYQGGGDMIASVTFEKTTYNTLPYKFEAGTPNIAGVVGFGAAVEYLNGIDREAACVHEDALLVHATELVAAMPGVRIIGQARQKTSVLSFVMDGIHPHDVGTVLDNEGVAIRTGQHCAQPVMDRYGIVSTARASFAFYNTTADVQAFVRALHKVKELLG